MAEQQIVVPLAFHLDILQAEASPLLRLKRELFNEQLKNSYLEALIHRQQETNANLARLLGHTKPSVPRVESLESVASTAVDDDPPVVGKYSPGVRRQKIQAYKLKKLKHLQHVHFSRHFAGRSQVAQAKPRLNGRFAKAES